VSDLGTIQSMIIRCMCSPPLMAYQSIYTVRFRTGLT